MSGPENQTATLVLAARLDTGQAAPLASAIRNHDGGDLALDAGQVTHLGALSLQVIRAAAQSWAKTGHRLTLVNSSDDCADHLALMGFDPETVTMWEGA